LSFAVFVSWLIFVAFERQDMLRQHKGALLL